MVIVARSKVTSQGQISIPAVVRQKLGLGPGSTLEWEEENDRLVVRRSGTFSSEDVHRALFPQGPPARRTHEELKEGIREHIRQRHASR